MYSSKPLDAFLSELSARTPVPGGGAACALAGALGAAQGAMCAAFTTGKRFRAVEAQAAGLRSGLESLRDRFLELVDRDAQAYKAYDAIRKLPAAAGQEQAHARRIAECREQATGVPEETLGASLEALSLCRQLADICNMRLIPDLLVSACLLEAAAQGAWAQVLANLESLPAAAQRRDGATRQLKECQALRAAVEKKVVASLCPPGVTDRA
jgi:formiminotetrahydrofolate cyclodeaminase